MRECFLLSKNIGMCWRWCRKLVFRLTIVIVAVAKSPFHSLRGSKCKRLITSTIRFASCVYDRILAKITLGAPQMLLSRFAIFVVLVSVGLGSACWQADLFAQNVQPAEQMAMQEPPVDCDVT